MTQFTRQVLSSLAREQERAYLDNLRAWYLRKLEAEAKIEELRRTIATSEQSSSSAASARS